MQLKWKSKVLDERLSEAELVLYQLASFGLVASSKHILLDIKAFLLDMCLLSLSMHLSSLSFI